MLIFPSIESAVYLTLDAIGQKNQPTFNLQGDFVTSIYNIQDTHLRNLSLFQTNETTITGSDVLITSTSPRSKKAQAYDQIFQIIETPDPLNPISSTSDTVIVGEEGYAFLFSKDKIFFWEMEQLQTNTGLILSSRKAEHLLSSDPLEKPNSAVKQEVKTTLAALENGSPEGCFLFPSGMAAVFTVYKSLLSPRRSQMIVLGTTYVDSMQIMSKWPERRGSAPPVKILDVNDRVSLASQISDKTAGIFFECPSNPLLQVPPISEVVALAKEHGVPVIVDSTMATPYNLHPFEYGVDVIIHSTTKFLNGRNNHLGGAVLVKDKTWIETLTSLQNGLKLEMDTSEAEILATNLKQFESRMQKINANGQRVAEFLASHDKIGQVWYPGLSSNPHYPACKKYMKHAGGVLSFVVNPSDYRTAETFYDHVDRPILKGPSLGSEQTLLMAYTILAHYDLIQQNPKKLHQMGLDPYLFRLSVGCEPVEEIVHALNHGLATIRGTKVSR
jgi:cystathionine gamma-synthase